MFSIDILESLMLPRPKTLMIAVMLTVLAGSSGYAIGQATSEVRREVELTDPAPDWDNPRRIVLQVTDPSPEKLGGVMSNAINLQKFYGPDRVEISIITYAAGIRQLLKENAAEPERVSSLQQYGIEFIACGNTLDTIGKSEADLLPGVTVVGTGIAEIVERERKGWHIIVP
jgi:intracellular sulfur oxidation DsrE/DsrF family protein